MTYKGPTEVVARSIGAAPRPDRDFLRNVSDREVYVLDEGPRNLGGQLFYCV